MLRILDNKTYPVMEWGILVEDRVEFKASKFVQETAEQAPENSSEDSSSLYESHGMKEESTGRGVRSPCFVT